MPNIRKNILIVDDDQNFRDYLVLAFKDHGYHVIDAKDVDSGLEAVKYNKLDLIITDMKMPGKNGIEFLRELKSIKPKLPVILITGFSTTEIVSEALKEGAINYFEKPFSLSDLLAYSKAIINLFSDYNTHYKKIAPYVDYYEKTLNLVSREKIIDIFPNYMIRELIELGYCTEQESLPITTAVIEALSNSLYHGNLEIDSDIRNSGSLDGQKIFKKQVHQRENSDKYQGKRIKLKCFANEDLITFEITDEGKGFDWRKQFQISSTGLQKFSGKGLFLINSLVDEVKYNNEGNVITLTKRVKKLNEK